MKQLAPIDEKSVNLLAKSYNTLDYSAKLIELLRGFYTMKILCNSSKYELHSLLNDILFNNYCGEPILKYKLFQHHINKPNIVAAFETKVNSSRLDFLTINGHTTSFEIKSKLDNLSKLNKQMSDYIMAFEYNYLVVDEKHIKKVKDLVQDNYGIWIYYDGKYETYKRAELNTKICPKSQLELLTKKELTCGFPECSGASEEVLHYFDAHAINVQFKRALKRRYNERWNFLAENQNSILPIDLQFFFKTNIEPSCIYNN